MNKYIRSSGELSEIVHCCCYCLLIKIIHRKSTRISIGWNGIQVSNYRVSSIGNRPDRGGKRDRTNVGGFEAWFCLQRDIYSVWRTSFKRNRLSDLRRPRKSDNLRSAQMIFFPAKLWRHFRSATFQFKQTNICFAFTHEGRRIMNDPYVKVIIAEFPAKS